MTCPLRSCRLAVVGLVALLTACSSPAPNLYTLGTVSGAPIANASASGAGGAGRSDGPKVVLLRQVGIAHYLERPQIVRSSENYRLDVMENDWRGEPLGEMLGRVLAEELRQRLSRSVVLTEAGTVSATPDATIEVDVQRLDEDASRTLVLQAQASGSRSRDARLRDVNSAGWSAAWMPPWRPTRSTAVPDAVPPCTRASRTAWPAPGRW